MCGIVGFIDYKKNSAESILYEMRDVLYKRGPDDYGHSFYDYDNFQLGLGHRRLSILDLSKKGHQPMRYKNLEIIFNGEIYNFKEIRNKLTREGYLFESNSDTEVVLKAFHKWGIEAVDLFIGMFVFALVDSYKKKLYLFRDRAGVKPLFWYWNENIFMFSSELKSFHKHPYFIKKIDKNSLALYLQYGYIPQPNSIFKNTKKLRAGYYLEFDYGRKQINENQYWNLFDYYNKNKLDITEDEAIKETNTLLESAFQYRMVSDVPVGIFLSGGYDSSLVSAILQKNNTSKVKTFTIGFKEKGFDEAQYAKRVANYLGTEHTEYYCTQKEARDIIPNLVDIYDEPFGDSSAIPTILVSQLARKDVTVSLSADGGDEIFGGYYKYNLSLKYSNFFKKIPTPIKKIGTSLLDIIYSHKVPFQENIPNFDTKVGKLINIINSNNEVQVLKYLSQAFTQKDLKKLLEFGQERIQNNFNNYDKLNTFNDGLNKLLSIDFQTYMVDDILTKVDRASMSVSLEGRDPLLDHRIIEFVAQLPSHLKINNGENKYLLKKLTHQYIPREIMDRPKKGFAIPIELWFKDELKEYFLKYLNKDRIEEEGLLNPDEVIKYRDLYFKGKNENVQRLWFILLFEMWYEKWMK
jgi:asparagine synthase (glutamine-hydrolysing)